MKNNLVSAIAPEYITPFVCITYGISIQHSPSFIPLLVLNLPNFQISVIRLPVNLIPIPLLSLANINI
jgi:hypothetical protein